ncbi:MAG: DNA polymerase domain-containing protein [Verrucomicrobiota bacterium]
MVSDAALRELVLGTNDEPGLVAAESVAGKGREEMILFIRRGSETVSAREPFGPFVWVEDEDLLSGYGGKVDVYEQEGRGRLKALAVFPSWKDLQHGVAWLKKKTGQNPSDPTAPFFLLNDPVQQHLLATGRTFFKGMMFEDLKRMQVDIETYTEPAFEFSNSDREGDRIIAIAMADQSGWSEVISGTELDEKRMLDAFVARVRERDPDVLEGHTLFKFDLPYLVARARRHGVKLAIGRDGSEPDVRPSRFITADRTVSYPRAEIFGRHVVDTYFLAQSYDVSHRSLEGFGLKEIAAHFGVSAPARTYLEGDEIARVFERDPATVMKYARDDILETRSVSNILSPSYFVQAQMLPFSYQNICVRGSGAKIDALLLREYLRRGRAIPLPDPPREFAGGYTDIFFAGVAKNVHHCDIRSLYPSLLLQRKAGPRSDDLGIFLKLLGYLRTLRLNAKERMQASGAGGERHHLEALQSTLKILINSFYGYLGFGQARFSDFDLAEQITAEGRALLKQMIGWIEKKGGKPIEIDTDGIYFVPPPFKKSADQEAFRTAFQRSLPEGIEIEFDGEYPAMFSYKMKNYALLDERGEITIKGAALKSRGLEPFQRAFLQEWLHLKLEERDGEIPALVKKYREAIEQRRWPIRMLAKTETLQDAPATYVEKIRKGGRGRNAAYELALASGREYRAGDQISYYVTGEKKSVAVHSSAKLVSDWDPAKRDENVSYYLAKLDALCRKFDSMALGDLQGELDLATDKENDEEA